PERVREDLDDEIAFHLDMRTEDLVKRGMDPAEAREHAVREFGDVDAARRALAGDDARLERRAGRRTWLDAWRQDLKFAARALRRRPGFTAAAVLTELDPPKNGTFSAYATASTPGSAHTRSRQGGWRLE
ncbi:MAG: permease prefix domain 1-containing protein, partial [Gemmatimonadota bacterium]